MKMLIQQLKTNMNQALKERDTTKLIVLRNLLAEIRNAEIDVKRELNDKEIISLIKKQVKVISEAKTMFTKGGRTDLADHNQQEIEILTEYLPEEMSEADLKKKVTEIIANNSDITNQGQLIGLCVRELKDLGDSSRIASLVKDLS